ncbi:MAG: hypothetical protein MOGDAGHF_00505 [Rhodocyclaceae bacterium]|nr:hypothetical protein [Rhodocyclaceae bacterium]
MATTLVPALLQAKFAAKHATAAVSHFQKMTEQFQLGNWEGTIGAGGKFIEACAKALLLHVGKTLPPARKFKVGDVMRDLKVLPQGSFDDTIRIILPRACEFIYDIASNRGARHDPDEIDSNEMDATVTVGTCAWTLSEMLRYAQKGTLDTRDVTHSVAGLMQRRYPSIEDIDGRIYFHVPGLSARDVALLTLWHQHPARITPQELIAAVRRHNYKSANASMAVQRIRTLVDVDSHGRYRLLAPGLQEAERLLASSKSGATSRSK